MFKRISIKEIISAHLKTLRSLNQASNGIYIPDLLLFFISPFLISLYLIYKDIELSSQITNLISAISILGGFLFNLLAIVYSIMDKLKDDSLKKGASDLKKKFVKEIHSNISFAILLSIFTTVFLIIYSFEYPSTQVYCCIKKLLALINYFLLILFFLTLLMILNRIFILLKKDVEGI